MVTVAIWWAGILLEGMILYRGLRNRLVSKYPFFYLYIASVLLADTSLYFVRMASPELYSRWNWFAALLNLILGYGIILEVFRHVLTPYPGVEKLARNVGLGIFGMIVCFAIGYPLVAQGTSQAGSTVQLERDFWAVQAMLLFGVLAVVSHYRLAIGANLKGIISGYGLCLAATLMAFSLRSYIGTSFRTISNFIAPFSVLIALAIWVIALWSSRPDPVSKPSVHLEADYKALVLRTKSMMGTMRSYLAKAVR